MRTDHNLQHETLLLSKSRKITILTHRTQPESGKKIRKIRTAHHNSPQTTAKIFQISSKSDEQNALTHQQTRRPQIIIKKIG